MKQIAVISLLAAGLACSALEHSAYAQADSAQQKPSSRWEEVRGALLDARLGGLKAGLKLTSEQENNWAPFDTAVRKIEAERAQRMREIRERWNDSDERPSPIGRMRSKADRLADRSADLKALADAAAPLYASLNDEQKRVFGILFRQLAAGRHEHRRNERG